MKRLPRLDASAALHRLVILQFSAAMAWLDSDRADPPPRFAIAGEAGLGKTAAVLKALAAPEWRDRRALYLVPSIDLADELATRARKEGVEAHVIRGRSQPRVRGGEERMCAKFDIAETVAALSHNITETLCSGPGKDGKKVECEYKDSCPYYRQLAESRKATGLLIGAHQYLPLNMELLKEDAIDLLVIDESFFQSLTRDARVNIDRFRTWRAVGSKGYGPKKGEGEAARRDRATSDTADFSEILDKAVAVLDAAIDDHRQPRLADFRAAGITPGDCRFAAGVEYSHLAKADIHPGMTEKAQREALAVAMQREAFGFARLWKVLAAELESGRDGELHGLEIRLGALNPRSHEPENIFALHYSAEPRFQGVPLLAIDADADVEILARFFPGIAVETIKAELRNVTIRQCADRTGSATAFKNPANREKAWNVALDLADALFAEVGDDPARRLLVIAQKSVREAWEADEAKKNATFDIEHFGAIRGKDDWKFTAGAVIVGRIEPSPNELERLARCVFYRDAAPLQFLPRDDEGRAILPKRDEVITAKDGTTATVAVSYHPDARADALLRQIREGELGQAIARVRPIHRGADNPCEIIVLTNVPLAFQPDTLATWSDLVPDRFDVMRLRGFLPDVASDCAVAYPELFDSPTAVRMAAMRARKAHGESVTVSIKDIIYKERYTFGTRVFYRLEGSRKGRMAWVRVRPGETESDLEARLADLLPGLHSLRFQPIPDAATQPEAAAEAIALFSIVVAQLCAHGETPWWIPPGDWRQVSDLLAPVARERREVSAQPDDGPPPPL